MTPTMFGSLSPSPMATQSPTAIGTRARTEITPSTDATKPVARSTRTTRPGALCSVATVGEARGHSIIPADSGEVRRNVRHCSTLTPGDLETRGLCPQTRNPRRPTYGRLHTHRTADLAAPHRRALSSRTAAPTRPRSRSDVTALFGAAWQDGDRSRRVPERSSYVLSRVFRRCWQTSDGPLG